MDCSKYFKTNFQMIILNDNNILYIVLYEFTVHDDFLSE